MIKNGSEKFPRRSLEDITAHIISNAQKKQGIYVGRHETIS